MFECDCPPDNCGEKVERYLNGDRAAGNEIAQKFDRLVRSIVQRVLGSDRREEWEDACQVIFLRLFANLQQWQQRCPFCKWLAVVAARRAIDVGRMTQSSDKAVPLEDRDPVDIRASPSSDTLERIDAITEKFPTEWQQVWRMWVDQHTREEMAQKTGRSLRTIQYWLAEMLDQIRVALREE